MGRGSWQKPGCWSLLAPLVLIFLLQILPFSDGQSVESMSGGTEGAEVAGNTVRLVVGENATLQCVGEGQQVYWRKGKHNITEDERHSIETASLEDELDVEDGAAEAGEEEFVMKQFVSTLILRSVVLHDAGHYHCLFTAAEGTEGPPAELSTVVRVHAAPVLMSISNRTDGSIGERITISCTFESNPAPFVTWLKGKTSLDQDKRFNVVTRNESNLHMSQLVLENATLKDNGTYECHAENNRGDADRPGRPFMIIHVMPSVSWSVARSLGPEDIQLVWEVQDNKDLVKNIEVWISDDGSEANAELWRTLEGSARSVVLGDGVVDAVKGGGQTIGVWLRLSTSVGRQVVSDGRNVTMLTKDPEFIPNASFRGSTLNSLTVFWSSPSEQQAEYVSYFLLSLIDVRSGATRQVKQLRPVSDHRFTNLSPGTQYNFTVASCMDVYSESKRDCGPPSPLITGNTLYNAPKMVEDVVVVCQHNGYSGWSVDVKWKPAKGAKEQGSVNHYKLELTSIAKYIDAEGQKRYEDNDRREENVSVNFTSYTFTDASANTHYTVKVFAGIKHMYSRGMTAQCRMPVWLPRQFRLQWWKADPSPSTTSKEYTAAGYTATDGTPRPALLKMPVPNISQRNGTICCYRVVIVKLAPGASVLELEPPEQLSLLSYRTAHLQSSTAAYVAEAYTSLRDRFLVLGDNKTVGGDWSEGCGACLESAIVTTKSGTSTASTPPRSTASAPATTTTTTTLPAATPTAGILSTSLSPSAESVPASAASLVGRRGARSPDARYQVEDGQLSSQHNYTGFLILTVNRTKGRPLHRYSSFFNLVRPVMDVTPSTVPPSAGATHDQQPILYVAVGVLLLLLIITIGLCALLFFYKRRNKHLEDELVYNESLSGSLGRKIFRSLRKSNTLMSQNSIDVKPINKEDLVKVYLENIKDSELGFRREYEALPEKFVDRSSRSSEQLENCCKNRYPDIKAYDQTRVKLGTSALHPSDYINANFVLGYKERKKFICAQGPMDATVDDFWRMVVEQGCSICVMLTNLEENGKLKCVKYWPEAGQPKTFGQITVRLVKEKSYADYIVRTLRAEWLVPTVGSNTELNTKGVVGGEGSTSTNTSSASNHSASVSEELKYHEVEQYHYLMWKDFVAPEHPVGILAFLRRMNEAYSHEKGPLLVHCSAGVGRTGTLVALDSLVMELDEEQQASVYNLICDLRHQRNFLVQSLKQYVFIHRALMEYAQFGSTEQTPQQLREAYVKHVSQVQQQATSPVLFQQFELLSKVIEERKAFTIATSEENKSKNRYDFVLPYDSNRVILSPVAGKPVNTYINASFVGGFDLDEHFIVTQDPLDNTVGDFWRMVYEQDVTTLVMLSELGSGENLCTRYWPEEDEGEVAHDMLRLKLLSSESYPKFSSRVMQLSNSKNGDTRQVTQFQYVGWSGSLGEVPVGTYGIMEVINRVQSHIHANLSASLPAPVLLHCSGGGDRCSVFVCLNNCLRHLRREGRVDVFQIARKIRSLRQFMLQEPSQYEFCYKALIEYIDSKGLDNI